MEISLPDEHGRYQILNIHTTRMKDFKKIAHDVNMKVNIYMLLFILSLLNLYLFLILYKCLGTFCTD